MTNKHLSKAKDYIGKGEQFYRKAAEEIKAALDEGATQREVANYLGRSQTWVSDLVKWRTSDSDHDPFGGPGQDAAQSKSRAKKFLSRAEPEQIKAIISELPAAQAEEIGNAIADVQVDRARARLAEKQAKPTAGSLMGGDKWDPSESWADTQIIRTNNNVRGLAGHVEKWGLVLGSMSAEEAFEYLKETERLIAEVRVVAQTQLRDGVTA